MRQEISSSLDSSARRVSAWVLVRRWVGALNLTLWYACGVIGLLALSAGIWGGGWGWAVNAAPFVWLAGTFAWGLWRRPGTYEVLALWDEAAGRREAFATAWWFERQATLTASAQSHLEAQRALFPAALPHLKNDLPLRPGRWIWLPVLLAFAGGLAARRAGPDTAPDVRLDEHMAEAAKREAERLARAEWEKKSLEGLTEEERKELEALQQNLQKTAETLETAGGQSAREVMSELERRARQAEKLAEKLASEEDAWASPKMVEALRSQADTADLGDAVAGRNAALAAKAADSLAEQLQSPSLPTQVSERFNDTLQQVGKNSETEDRERTVGQHVLEAGDQLRQAQAQAAGAEFEKLAERMRALSLREQSRKELEKLAQQLRESGSNITGQEGENGAMQPMTAAGQQGQQGQAGTTPQVGQAQQSGQGAPQSLQPPGLGQQGAPQQGQGEGRQMQMAQPGQAGQPGQDGAPMLFAPIPGQKPGDKPPEMLILGGPAENSGDGGMTFSMPGGKDPGVGKAELNASATERLESAGTTVVNAAPGGEGPSSSRTVAGAVRQENATQTSTKTAVEFLAVEEAALDEAELPAIRREQVRRYFNELRSRFDEGQK